jgi:hypothetical protein
MSSEIDSRNTVSLKLKFQNSITSNEKKDIIKKQKIKISERNLFGLIERQYDKKIQE